ncbi:dTDP-4-amino-4,6-dideoxygalactose transaminase [Hymenobacter taeanensis]|uniref:dTDP-4-amino-4,6-dideoxygalactose transaminase n=1 Tax=Hymenobacter taeanensis TaxID=2735321 RepID=A0A6M6BKH8_9BACT|nr:MULTISPECIES: dTDP-4-amino-4,6-dideoxygalactose transaminase [Hymenobacter]QJX47565.1 dTDP-4-amino-4,6-dideoxygalactose transaminase [Hymenobacter taeanensis]UOQ82952.1 dTDP-4-amino-4,6-dideoxygalactose transaminase [Hymenobacter sp. 5414T-23]
MLTELPFHIPFNKPYLTGNELRYIAEAAAQGKLSGNGAFTHRCQEFFQEEYGFGKALLTNSGTAALEMAALLLDLQPGDEVILPSFTFTSTANAFLLRGATLRFADSSALHPNLDPAEIARLITPRTRAVVVVHYAGVACNLAAILPLIEKHHLILIEDAAQAIESFHDRRRLGSVGHFAAFSFHETKNISAGEGGLLAINDAKFARRAEIIWEKGTNRAAFFRGETAKYQWVDIGSSFLPSEMTAAFLWAQLEHRQCILQRRRQQWITYEQGLAPLAALGLLLPHIPVYAQEHNGHIFYLICRSFEERQQLIQYLADQNILAVFHYQPLHNSPYFHSQYSGPNLRNSENYAQRLLRLPLYYELSEQQQSRVINHVLGFYTTQHLH